MDNFNILRQIIQNQNINFEYIFYNNYNNYFY